MSMIPFTPQPCENGCCASIFTGFCLADGTAIAVVINNGLAVGWINISTGVFTNGPIPIGAGPCPIPVEVTTFIEVDLDCETDSITVCQGTDPWIVSGDVIVTATDLDIRPLNCVTDSITVCPGDVFHVIVDNTVTVQATDLDIRPLSCLTDSIEICNDAGNPIPVTFPRLNCLTDSVEICNDFGNPVPVSFVRLNCITDSIEICNDIGSPITVNVTNVPHVIIDSLPEVEIKNDIGNPIPVSFTRLNCATDSVEICNDIGNPIPVSFTRLNCATDSVEICNDAGNPITVSAVDLDIRNLTCAQDSVTVCQPTVAATLVSTAQNIASVTVLAANVNRKGAIIYNNSSSTAWIKFGATASQTSFSVRIVSETFYELTVGYVGIIDAIWQGAGAGAMRVTEFT